MLGRQTARGARVRRFSCAVRGKTTRGDRRARTRKAGQLRQKRSCHWRRTIGTRRTRRRRVRSRHRRTSCTFRFSDARAGKPQTSTLSLEIKE